MDVETLYWNDVEDRSSPSFDGPEYWTNVVTLHRPHCNTHLESGTRGLEWRTFGREVVHSSDPFNFLTYLFLRHCRSWSGSDTHSGEIWGSGHSVTTDVGSLTRILFGLLDVLTFGVPFYRKFLCYLYSGVDQYLRGHNVWRSFFFFTPLETS